MNIPPFLLVHEVTVTPKTGRSSTGDVYGAPFTFDCMAQGGVRLVRAPDGAEVVSSLTLYAAPGEADRLPPGSLVEHAGDTTVVIAAIDQDDGGLGAPRHTEVVCE